MISSVAVFVDAGYLFAQGSVALSGQSKPRSQLSIDGPKVVAALQSFCAVRCKGSRLLRIYWYDGTQSGRLSIDQQNLANADDIKLRLGQINSLGQQKGVDSLIVTDLVELARNRAMDDAVLVSGDEDVRIGVQIAQNFGVRIHLLGIEGSNSQSQLLLQEADTKSIWQGRDVAGFLAIKPSAMQAQPPATSRGADASATIRTVAEDLAESFEPAQVQAFHAYREKSSGLPPEFDGKLLGKARDAIGRDLTATEKKMARGVLVEALKARTF